MNITKEQMLERIREWKGAFDTHPDKMDEWSLCFMEDYEVYNAIRSLIESSSPAPLPAEVEEAMETLTMLVEVDGDVLENAALAVIRAALTATIKPTLTVAPTIQVTREWLTGAIGTIAFRAFTCENHRALVDCIEQDMARLEEMLRELGIEVEP
jgi:hypothetical protein